MNRLRQLLQHYRNTTFHRQLAILAATCVLSVSLLAALTTAWQSSRQIRATQLLQGQRIAQSLASQSRLALIFGSPENVEEAVAATLSFPDVIRVELHHADGRLLLARGDQNPGDASATSIAASRGAFLESEDDSGWRFVAPVLTQAGGDSPFEMTERKEVALGYVRVSQSKATLSRLMREVFLVNFATGLVFAIIFLLALRILVRRLTRPLSDLSETMARAEAGENGLRAGLSGPRDLVDMAHAFNSMMNALEEREAELRTARDSALRFAKLKADFAATVSHEVRTPLNGVIGTLDMLKTGPMTPDQHQLLELAWDSSQYLLELINNILDFSKLEAGRMEAERSDFELRPLVDSTLNVFAAQAAAKGLELSADLAPAIPPRLMGDPARIRQVLTNLIGNAIKFTEHGRIDVTAAPDPDGCVRFTVTDTGIGIAAEYQESIFDSFTQADTSTTRRFGGSGLGLAICKQLVRMLGGQIGVVSHPGQGSSFWFTVPCLPAPAAVGRAAAPAEHASGGEGHILIVEDNQTNRVVAAGMLRLLGCTSGMAENGTQAITAWQSGNWDLVLMDCNMPETDGYQATASIRRQEAVSGRRIPIIAMTANTQPVDIEKCLAAGMDDHLAKPLTLQALAAKLQRWLHWTGSEREQLPVEPEPAEEECLDTTVLQRLREALGSSIGEAIQPFLEDMPGYLAEMDTAVAEGNATALRRVAHIIKGAAGNLGANAVAGVAKEIELHAEAGALAESVELMTRLRTEFALVEPALIAHLTAAGLASDPAVPDDAPLILVVDDDRSTRSALRHVLRRSGYRVEEAGDGDEALAWLEGASPDAILMDAMMPIMDGFTACAALKKHPLWRDIPVLMITALDDRQSIERAFEAGASDFIPKPIHLSVVNQRVRRIVDATRAERHVRELVYNDTLTGLPNRALFMDKLNRSIERTAARSGMIAVLFLDLDRFKYVNDTLGHEVGDRLLTAMAQRIKGCVRSDDCVARLGGDEFTILLEDIPNPGVAGSVAQNIGRTISAPLEIDGQEIFVAASIGISIYPTDGPDVSSLLRHADTAMYRAKQTRSGFAYYEAAMESDIAERVQLENALRRALERDEITVFYQPVVDTRTGAIASVEALVRWRHPVRGIISPVEFIPVAEETGLILALGERVLRTACFQTKAWLDSGLPLQRVAVNLSAKQLEQENLCDVVLSALKDSGLPPDVLILEITESVLMEQAQDPASILHSLRDLGVRISIDDFGTGYSSLAYLKHLPADYLKIDRSFIKDIPEDADAVAIVTGIMTLAHSLRLTVVAEGVELEAQRDQLSTLNCDYLQGFLYSKPVPAELLETQLLTPPPQRQRSKSKKAL
ncbi:MAG TPA: EAL domain-containing protein [Rhodocyclaceae bacterium]|nr:EAL domain-containing protein [Rhodocyclaceae bacterium]